MGLLPEFFMLLGIDIFLAMSLLSALLDKELPSTLQYLFQGAAIIGLGQLFINQGYVNTGVFGQTPTDPTPEPASVSQPATTSENGETPAEISLDTELPFNLRTGRRDEWEEAPSKDEVGGDN